MAFGFAIGDFIAVGQLAWTLYRECYQIASSITLLQEEAKDPKSTSTRSGDDRIRMVNEMVAGIGETLKRLRDVASKYDILGSNSKTKRVWAKIKWSAELSSIDRLRNKLIYYNTLINLLLFSVGNSSLQRIESSNAALASDVQAIKNYIASTQVVIGSKKPALSAFDDDLMSTTLSASLMANAEASQPWSTIGFNQWIGAGKWWLLRAQLVLRTIVVPEQSVAPAAYADLIKAGWILADVIPCHPQFPFISASKSSELRSLSDEVKDEVSRVSAMAMVVPALDKLRTQDLRLWESIFVKAPLLRPYKDSQNLDAWRVDGGEHVLFGKLANRKLDSVTTSPCILLLLVHESAKAARLIAQDQYGDIVMAISFRELSVSGKKSNVRSIRRSSLGCIVVGGEKFVLNRKEAQTLCTMIEATTFYLLGRQVDHSSLEDLKIYMLLTAVKNKHEEATVQIRQESPEMNNIVKSNQKESLARLAVSMASQWIQDRLLADHWIEVLECGDPIPLFTWAVTYNHTALIEFLLSEDPVIDQSEISHLAGQGNEPAARWLLSDASAREQAVTKSLFTAITKGHENVVPILVEACTSLCGVMREALSSAMSEPVVHAIIAMVYATNSQSEFHLREAADRGHEGAIVLLSYAEILKRPKRPDRAAYLSHLKNDSGYLKKVVALFARKPNIVPAFDLTLMTMERRRTQVFLKVVNFFPPFKARIYLDSYHAYIEDVLPQDISETYEKAIDIERNGEFAFSVVHQEESLKLTLGNDETWGTTEQVGFDPWDPYEGPLVSFEVGDHIETIRFDNFDECSVDLPIS